MTNHLSVRARTATPFTTRSPLLAKKVVSPTDMTEVLGEWVGAVADVIHPLEAGLPAGAKFEGRTCEDVCSWCVLTTKERAEGPCYCKADCRRGPDATACDVAAEAGWTDSKTTIPNAVWEAKCNMGTKDCESECLKAEFVEKVHKCANATNAPSCYYELKLSSWPKPLDSREDILYCTRELLQHCDRFVVHPWQTEWQCFRDEERCKASIGLGSVKKMRPYAPSVWKQVYRGIDLRWDT